MCSQRHLERLIKLSNACIIEPRSHGCVHRHFARRLAEGTTVSLHLLAHVTQGILRPFSIRLIDRHHIRVIQHFDLFKL